MAEEIIQLRKGEYDDLVKSSRLKKKQIAEEARKIWEKEGIAELDIEIKRNQDWKDHERIECRAYVFDRYGTFTIPYELRKRLGDIAENYIRDRMTEMYGDAINDRNHYIDLKRKQNNWFRLAWLVAVSGWVVAAILMIGG